MNNTADDRIVAGRFGKVHGLKGFITVHSFTEPRDNILKYTEWHAFINKLWKPIKLLQVEANNRHIIVKVEGYAERDQVAVLTNVDIGVSAEQLPVLAEGEFYWHQLIGMQVSNQQNEHLGQVTEILPTGSNDVMVVSGNKRHLIPWLPGLFVIRVDAVNRSILVDWDADF